jgi:hypothetical protein
MRGQGRRVRARAEKRTRGRSLWEESEGSRIPIRKRNPRSSHFMGERKKSGIRKRMR